MCNGVYQEHSRRFVGIIITAQNKKPELGRGTCGRE